MNFSETRTAEILDAMQARAGADRDKTPTMTDIMLAHLVIKARLDMFVPRQFHYMQEMLDIHELIDMVLKMSLALRAKNLPDEAADAELAHAVSAAHAFAADLRDLQKRPNA